MFAYYVLQNLSVHLTYPGWIKTFQDYYSQQTRHILTSVINALAEDERRRFIWAEISFFDLWWNEQSDDRKELTKKYVSYSMC